MARVKNKKRKFKFEVKKTSLFWTFFIYGVIVCLAAVFFAPFWNDINPDLIWSSWSSFALGILLAASILVYVIVVLIKKLRQPGISKIVKLVFGFEFASMVVLAGLCVLYSFLQGKDSRYNFLNACQIVAIILWVRGLTEMINAYYYNPNSEVKQFYPVWYLLINILFITLGPILFTLGLSFGTVIDLYVSYFFSLLLLFLGGFLISYGFLSKPIKIKEEPIEDEPLSIEDKKEDNEQKDIKQIEENKDETNKDKEPLKKEEEVQLVEEK